MTKKCVQRIGNFLSAVMLVLKIAKMEIALGSKMSELITSVFKGEKQNSTISLLWLILCCYFTLVVFTM